MIPCARSEANDGGAVFVHQIVSPERAVAGGEDARIESLDLLVFRDRDVCTEGMAGGGGEGL